MKKTIICLLFIASCFWLRAGAVEISLDEKSVDKEEKNVPIGYVDIEKVFDQHPMAVRLRAEFYQEADKKKNEITNYQNEIAAMKKIVISSTTYIAKLNNDLELLKNPAQMQQVEQPESPEPMETSSSTQTTENMQKEPVTPPAPAEPAVVDEKLVKKKEENIKEANMELDLLQKHIKEKETELAKLLANNKDDLAKLEEDLTGKVLTDIYHILEKISEEEKITVILDKNQIVYGQAVKDLTDKVIDRLRGR